MIQEVEMPRWEEVTKSTEDTDVDDVRSKTQSSMFPKSEDSDACSEFPTTRSQRQRRRSQTEEDACIIRQPPDPKKDR